MTLTELKAGLIRDVVQAGVPRVAITSRRRALMFWKSAELTR